MLDIMSGRSFPPPASNIDQRTALRNSIALQTAQHFLLTGCCTFCNDCESARFGLASMSAC
jgi:hypothetical protein